MSTTTTVPVSSRDRRTNSGITLATGQAATITPHPQDIWDVWGNPSRAMGYGGDLNAIANDRGYDQPQYPAPGQPEGDLIVFVGDTVFPFSHYKTEMVVTGPGILSFGPNDDKLDDNNGVINVDVTLADV